MRNEFNELCDRFEVIAKCVHFDNFDIWCQLHSRYILNLHDDELRNNPELNCATNALIAEYYLWKNFIEAVKDYNANKTENEPFYDVHRKVMAFVDNFGESVEWRMRLKY